MDEHDHNSAKELNINSIKFSCLNVVFHFDSSKEMCCSKIYESCQMKIHSKILGNKNCSISISARLYRLGDLILITARL